MANRDIVVIGGSAGSIAVLRKLVMGLPADLRAALCVVVHLSPGSPGLLPEILASAGRLPAGNARHGEAVRPGHIYVAPPDRHLLIQAPGRVHLSHGPKENRFRPAIDPLFRSAALAFGPRVVGVVLSGGLDDGTAGLQAIKQAGGLAIVQDPEEAEVRSMPASALRHVAVDHKLAASEMPALLTRLAKEPSEAPAATATRPAMPRELEIEVEVQSDDTGGESVVRELGEPSLFACPECHGSLIEIRNSFPLRFRCHTGHAYSAASLETELGDKIEDALWNTIRALEEHAMLLNRMAEHGHGDTREPGRLRFQAQDSLRRSRLIRRALEPSESDAAE